MDISKVSGVSEWEIWCAGVGGKLKKEQSKGHGESLSELAALIVTGSTGPSKPKWMASAYQFRELAREEQSLKSQYFLDSNKGWHKGS